MQANASSNCDYQLTNYSEIRPAKKRGRPTKSDDQKVANVLHIAVTTEMYHQLARIAEKERRTLSQMVRVILAERLG